LEQSGKVKAREIKEEKLETQVNETEKEKREELESVELWL
jgi:hypothetical protein